MKRALLALASVVLLALSVGAKAADERTATDGTRSLAVSKVRDLNPDGEAVEVQGSGYDESKGIYLAFCLIPPKGQKPSPCSGGDDRDGASGGSIWISNGPNTALGAKPYGPNGSFRFRLYLRAVISDTVDCRVARCGVVTRNDHTRGDDRSQDLFVPVYFRATSATTQPPPGASPPTTLPPPVLPTTTTTTIAAQFAPPTTTVADDGRSVTGGGRTLSSSKVRGVSANEAVTVSGRGFDTARGIYVSLCAVATGAAPGPCASGSAGAQAWISSNPPNYGKQLATPYGDGGSFTATITLRPVIDAEHDCRQISCAITTRNDDSHATDRSQDLALPVSFASRGVGTAPTLALRTTSSGDASSDDTSSRAGIAAAVVGLVFVAAGFGIGMRERRGS